MVTTHRRLFFEVSLALACLISGPGCKTDPTKTVPVDRHHPRSPTPVVGLTDALDIAAGPFVSCAVRKDGTVWCWGSGRTGLLGEGSPDRTLVPRQVPGVAGALDVELNLSWACARCKDRSLVCWGGKRLVGEGGPETRRFNEVDGFSLDSHGLCIWAASAGGEVSLRCGSLPDIVSPDGTPAQALTPWRTAAGPLAQVTGPDPHMSTYPQGCIVAASGSVDCNARYGDRFGPVPALTGASRIGFFDGWIVALRNGELLGVRTRHGKGSLALDTLHDWNPKTLTPLQVPAQGELTGFVRSLDRLCVWAKDGRAWCFEAYGSRVGREGQLLTKPAEELLPAGDLVQLVIDQHTCLRRATGQVACWGNNAHGQVGNGRLTKIKRKIDLKF